MRPRHLAPAAPLLAALLAAAAPARADDSRSLLPLAEGRRWTYQARTTTRAAVVSTTTEGVASATCGARESVDGRDLWRLAWRDDEGREAVAWVRADAEQVEVARASQDRLPLLPARAEPGRLEDVRVAVDRRTVTLAEVVVRGVERVTTPHGEHEALRVDALLQAPATRVRTSVWYARGVGPVKIVEVTEAPATRVERELLLRAVEGPALLTPEAPTPGPSTPPAPPPAPAGSFDLAALVRDAASAGGEGPAMDRLRALAGEVLGLAERRAGWAPAPGARGWAEGGALRTVAGRDLQRVGGYTGAVVVCDGPLQVMGGVNGAVILATGPVEVMGGVNDSLVIALGEVQVAGGVRGSVLAVRGGLEVAGGLQRSVAQAGRLQVGGGRRDAVVVEPGPDDLLTPLR
ncbi:MAG: FapA family protein [Planctomycetes bacterium]|nr:FapA family protein [Planctomycetota bacterium]